MKIFKKTLQFYQNKHNDKSPMKIKNIFMLSMLCGCSLSFGQMLPLPENVQHSEMVSYHQTKDIRLDSGNARKFRHGNSHESGGLPHSQHFGNRPPPPPNFGNVPPPHFMSKQMMKENCKKIELAKGVLQQTKEACNKKDVSSAILSFIEYWILKEELLFSNSPMAFCNKSGKNGDLAFADANGIDQREAEDHNNRPQSVLSIQEEDNKQ